MINYIEVKAKWGKSCIYRGKKMYSGSTYSGPKEIDNQKKLQKIVFRLNWTLMGNGFRFFKKRRSKQLINKPKPMFQK
jgi:hypothetical protein